MALDVYFRKDIQCVLNAIDMAQRGVSAIAYRAMSEMGRPETHDRLGDYNLGYEDALRAVALAFDLTPENDIKILNITHDTRSER